VIGYCERLRQEDVAANRAMGQVGRDAVLAATEALRAGRKLRILTHCNTGSLATANYGTALGVVRALHEVSGAAAPGRPAPARGPTAGAPPPPAEPSPPRRPPARRPGGWSGCTAPRRGRTTRAPA